MRARGALVEPIVVDAEADGEAETERDVRENPEAIAPRATVEAIVRSYQEAEKQIRQACGVISGAMGALNETLGLSQEHYRSLDFGRVRGVPFPFDEPDEPLLGLRREIWGYVVARLELTRMLSLARQKELSKWLETTTEEITVDSVFGLFETYRRQLPDMLGEAVGEVYDFLRPAYSTKKTNSQYELGRRVILEGWLDGWWLRHGYGPRVSGYRDQHVRALDNVFAALDGRGSITKSWRGDLGDAISKAKTTGTGETRYFRFRTFVNGNLHLEFLRMDLVAKFNQLAGGRRLKHETDARRQAEAEA